MDTPNFLALAVKPLDVATPLMYATKIKEAQVETQSKDIQMRRDAIGAEARGLAPLVGSPDFEQAHQAAGQRLAQMGVLDTPQAQAGWQNQASTPLGLRALIAGSNPPALAESERHNKATEAQSAAQLGQTATMNAAQIENMKAQRALQERQQSFTQMQPVKIGADLGGDIYAVRDPKTGGYHRIDMKTGQISGTPVTGGAPGVAPDTGSPGTPPVDPATLTGEPFLKTMEPGQAALVKKIANYELDPRVALSMKGGNRERVMAAVAQYDPSYDGTTYPARGQAVKDFSTGKLGNTVRSFDVAISHIDTARGLVTALNNGDTQAFNRIANIVKDQFGLSSAPANFDAAKEIIGDEIIKAVVGSGSGALGDRESIKKNINGAKSPEILNDVLNTYEKLMAGQVTGVKKQYEDTTRLKNFDERLSPRTRQRLLAHQEDAAVVPEISDARAAIAKGAPRDAVEKRLKEKGIKFNSADLDLK